MDLKFQKRLAAKTLGVGIGRIHFNTSRYEDIKEAITKADIRSLAKQGAISAAQISFPSRHRARARAAQQKKGRQRGQAAKRGRKNARNPEKRAWINKIRSIRKMLNNLKENKKIDNKTYRNLYMKAKGGFFRDRSHLTFYIESSKMVKK